MSSPATIPVVLLATADEEHRFAITTALRLCAPETVLVEVRDGDQFLNWLQLSSERADRLCFPIPDLVLLDLDLPGKDALCVLRWLRRDDGFACSHVAVLTPASRLWRIHDAFRAGADSFLAAPIDTNEFCATYEAVARDMWTRRPDSANQPPLPGFSML